MTEMLPWVVLAVVGLLAVVLLGRWLSKLLWVGLRACGAFLLLTIIQPLGLGLGANGVNALVIAVLGAPGFGLLLMLQWALR